MFRENPPPIYLSLGWEPIAVLWGGLLHSSLTPTPLIIIIQPGPAPILSLPLPPSLFYLPSAPLPSLPYPPHPYVTMLHHGLRHHGAPSPGHLPSLPYLHRHLLVTSLPLPPQPLFPPPLSPSIPLPPSPLPLPLQSSCPALTCGATVPGVEGSRNFQGLRFLAKCCWLPISRDELVLQSGEELHHSARTAHTVHTAYNVHSIQCTHCIQ